VHRNPTVCAIEKKSPSILIMREITLVSPLVIPRL